jgi:O-succinylbenzoic acid--CoA ligase
VQLRQLGTESLAAGLADALAGLGPVSPACEPRLAAALALGEPVTEPGAAVVVPTSGTTGEPRAVVLTADAITFSANASHARLGGPGDWVCALPTQHIAGLMTVARAVVAGTGVRFARGDLADLPPAGPRTYLSLVAAQLDRALAEPRLVSLLGGYAAVLLGGSAIPSGLVGRATAAGLRVVTTYGASETCGGCVYDGRPLDGVRVELDGERIGLGGPMAFAGYRLRPDLTASVLAGDLVRTSDRGRFADGRLQVLGRIDDVVISGGEKVDLAVVQEVCDAAFGAPAEGGVAVLAVPDERWGTRVVGLTTGQLALSEVRARLEPVVGRAAIPKELRRVTAMAYTSLGKIDKVALRRAWDGER